MPPQEMKLGAPESLIEVRLLKRPKVKGKIRRRADQITNEKKRMFLRVCLYSDVKRGPQGALFSHADIEIGGKNFRKRVEAAGGALAEYQNANYGDQHDPSHCARTARDVTVDLLQHA